MPQVQDIAAAFDLGGRILNVQPYGHGLINDTFIVITDTNRRAILQRINRHVFPRPDLIIENLRILSDHIHKHQTKTAYGAREIRIPEMISTLDGKHFLTDAAGGFWRAMGFIENSRTLETITTLAQAEEVGFALGRFHAQIHDLDPMRLHEILPGFHNAPGYLTRFTQATRHGAPDQAELSSCFTFIEVRQGLAYVLETAKRAGKLCLRVIHGDTKLNNFLFDATSNRAVSLIDLDTVQPGLIHFDVGDCLRSCANTAGESPADIDVVHFDLDICRAVLKHYLAETQRFMTQNDYHYLYDTIRLIPFELGLRFLTDHLEGNHYFKTDWPGQNLHRALVQFRLTANVEQSEDEIKSLIIGLMPVR